MFTSYQEVLDFLYHFTPAYHRIGPNAFKPGLEKTYQLNEYFHEPHKNYLTIHVGGTNGKGSVSHALASILIKAGYQVGLYTSPHLVDFVERIKVNGKMAPHEFVIDFVIKHQPIIHKVEPSFFEFTTFMAFEYFQQQKVDIAVIEVGMGGRLDTTNVIRPILSIITNVSYDHQMFLGNTLEKIAAEKAGIIKNEIPVIIGEHQKETDPVFVNIAHEKNAPIYFAEDSYDWFILEKNNKFQTLKDLRSNQIFTTDLTGNYQQKNLKTILKATEFLTMYFPLINYDIIQQGLKQVKTLSGLRGRMEWINYNGLKILLDVGHNEAGISELIDYLKDIDKKRLHFILGFVNDKDIHSILSLFPKNAHYYFLKPQVERGLEADSLSVIANQKGLYGNPYRNFESILTALQNIDPEDNFIIICGSCFLVGDFIHFLNRNIHF